jgi:hypothetical protein
MDATSEVFMFVFRGTLVLAWSALLVVACEAKVVLPPVGEAPAAQASDQDSQVVTDSQAEGDFFNTGQTVPPMVAAFLSGKKAVLTQDGAQKLCVDKPGPPCVGKLRLSSGVVKALGTEYLCRFEQVTGAFSVIVVDASDAEVFRASLPMPSLQGLSIPTEFGGGGNKISVVTPCSL